MFISRSTFFPINNLIRWWCMEMLPREMRDACHAFKCLRNLNFSLNGICKPGFHFIYICVCVYICIYIYIWSVRDWWISLMNQFVALMRNGTCRGRSWDCTCPSSVSCPKYPIVKHWPDSFDQMSGHVLLSSHINLSDWPDLLSLATWSHGKDLENIASFRAPGS